MAWRGRGMKGLRGVRALAGCRLMLFETHGGGSG